MNASNYVAPDGAGGWVVYANGQFLGTYPTQQQAEAIFQYVTVGGAPGSAYVPPAGSSTRSSGTISDADIVTWANNLGRPDLVNWAREFVRKNGRLPNSLAEVAGATGSGGGGTGGGQQYMGGTYGLDAAARAEQMAYQLKLLEELQKPGLDLQRRQQLMAEYQAISSMTGYVQPGLWDMMRSGLGITTSQTQTTGGYDTANGAKTVQQMRDELISASGGGDEWKNKSDAEVISQYGVITGKPVTPQAATAASSEGGTGNGPSTFQQMVSWVNDYTTRAGRPPSQGEWEQRLVLLAGVTPEQARAMYQRERQYQSVTGKPSLDEGEWMRWLGQVAPQKTLPREQMELNNQLAWANLYASKSGPQDYWVSNLMRANMPESVQWGNMKSLTDATPSFGAVRPSDNSWEQTYANWLKQQNGGTSGGTGAGSALPMGRAQYNRNPEWESGKSRSTVPGDTGQPPAQTGPQPQQPATRTGDQGGRDYEGPGDDSRWEPPGTGPADWRGTLQPGQTGTGVQTPGTYQHRPITDVDRAYNAARQAAGDYREDFRYAPQGWQPGQPVNYQPPQPRNGAPPADPWRLGGGGDYEGPGDDSRWEPPGTGPADWRGTFQQPNQLSRRRWSQMSPSLRQMQLGQWSAYGQDPQDAFDLMKRSWQGGQANTRTQWR